MFCRHLLKRSSDSLFVNFYTATQVLNHKKQVQCRNSGREMNDSQLVKSDKKKGPVHQLSRDMPSGGVMVQEWCNGPRWPCTSDDDDESRSKGWYWTCSAQRWRQWVQEPGAAADKTQVPRTARIWEMQTLSQMKTKCNILFLLEQNDLKEGRYSDYIEDFCKPGGKCSNTTHSDH